MKVCYNCQKKLTKKTKVYNRRLCISCNKKIKAIYDKKRDRTKPVVEYIKQCKFCLMDFTTTKHDKLYCCEEHKKRYINAVRRTRRRKGNT